MNSDSAFLLFIGFVVIPFLVLSIRTVIKQNKLKKVIYQSGNKEYIALINKRDSGNFFESIPSMIKLEKHIKNEKNNSSIMKAAKEAKNAYDLTFIVMGISFLAALIVMQFL